jgi:phosphoribosyl-AMP cyclohydrolase
MVRDVRHEGVQGGRSLITGFSMPFSPPSSDKHALEEGAAFTPKFDANGLIACVTQEAATGEILMLAYMNDLALQKTLETRVVHYWSRSRNALWRKGDTSGQVQKLVDLRVDCDQDAVLARVEAGGDGKACHTGRKSCFYRAVTPEGRLSEA